MKKHKFTGIIILMALSLMGIISVQIFWMNKAISIKEEQFNQQVNQALARASHRIERNQNAYFMSSLFGRMPNIQIYQNNKPINASNDSTFTEFSEFWYDKAEEKNIKVHKIDNNGFETVNYTFDTIIENGNSKQHIQTYSQITKPKENKIIISNEISTNKDFSHNSAEVQLNEVMEQMILEFTVRDISIEDRLSYSVVAPTIEYELKNSNIPLKFEYAIADYSGKIYNKLKTKGFKNDKAKNAFKTVLFPSDILIQSDMLMLYFPNKINYLTNNLLWPFTGSVIFTLIILIIFYSTLRIIFNQKKVSEIKNDFINNMTHEFKTPIATISLAADSITNPNILNSPEKVNHFTNIIKEENRRMNRQVESVLKMSLIDKKDFNLIVRETKVHPLIEQAVKNIRLQVEQKNGEIELSLSADNNQLKVDETHFTNLVYNLLDNANKYSLNEPPQIQVSSYNLNDRFYLAVTDNGIGMDKEMQEKIFEKFYRVPTGNVHTVKGFGLGLSYVKAIIMQFNGNISVKSKKNIGSTFTIEIPCSNV